MEGRSRKCPLGRDAGLHGQGKGNVGRVHRQAASYPIREDLHQDAVFPQPVLRKQHVLRTHKHLLADGYHSVVLENRCYLPTEEPGEACLLKSGRDNRGGISCFFSIPVSSHRDACWASNEAQMWGKIRFRQESWSLASQRHAPPPALSFHFH